MLDYLQRLQQLKTILQNFCFKYVHSIQEQDYHDCKKAIEEWGKSSTDLGSDLEISFRTILQEYSSTTQPPPQPTTDPLASKDPIEQTMPIHFIKFTIDFALIYPNLSSAFGKIPFLLIEDYLDCQTIYSSKQIWAIIESLVEKITTPSLFSKGKFVILKTCNALLKKLSKSYDTEFCGRILMFLAAVYPISERSALNLSGKVNVNNHTYYESKEKYLENIRNLNNKEYEIDEGDNKESASVKPVGEDGEEIDQTNLPFVITYDLYESFWKLQSYFASELKVFDTAATSTSWNEFLENAKIVFNIFKRSNSSSHHAVSNHQENSNTAISSQNDSVEEDYFGCKYLTSSQLFSLQLKDPLLRKQIAVQFLFLVHYLKVKALPLIENEAIRHKYDKDLKSLHDQAKSLIIDNNSGGTSAGGTDEFIETMQRIFTREEHWFDWKAKACAPFDRPPMNLATLQTSLLSTAAVPTITTSTGATDDENGKSQKRKFDEIQGNSNEISPISIYQKLNQNIDTKRRSYLFNTSKENITEISKHLAAAAPGFESQIQLYLEADDPEAGIEDDYHPKHDHLYCWRTRRLFAEKHLTMFRYMQDGNLGKGLRKLKNLPEPIAPVTDNGSAATALATEDQSLQNEGIVEESAMVIEVNETIVAVNEDKVTTEGEIVETASVTTPSNQIIKAFAEPEDGEEVEESTETKMEI